MVQQFSIQNFYKGNIASGNDAYDTRIEFVKINKKENLNSKKVEHEMLDVKSIKEEDMWYIVCY
jgi:hypothetical protein